MTRRIHVLAALVLLLAGASSALATQINTTLGFLLDNNYTVTAGDKLFDQWYIDGDTGSVDPFGIYIDALADGGLDPGPGLRFSADQGVLSAFDGDILNYTIGFRVTVLDPNLRIKDNSLNLLSWAVDPDEEAAAVGINEWIGTSKGLNDLGMKDVYYYEEWDGYDESQLSDSAEFDPQTQIWVEKHIQVYTEDDGDSADLYMFEQRFSQTPAVPEPATMGLSTLAMLALGSTTMRRRRR